MDGEVDVHVQISKFPLSVKTNHILKIHLPHMVLWNARSGNGSALTLHQIPFGIVLCLRLNLCCQVYSHVAFIKYVLLLDAVFDQRDLFGLRFNENGEH